MFFFSFFDVDVCDGAICVVIQRKNTASKSTACLSRITRADMDGVGGGDHRLKNERKRTETRTFILGGGGLWSVRFLVPFSRRRKQKHCSPLTRFFFLPYPQNGTQIWNRRDEPIANNVLSFFFCIYNSIDFNVLFTKQTPGARPIKSCWSLVSKFLCSRHSPPPAFITA